MGIGSEGSTALPVRRCSPQGAAAKRVQKFGGVFSFAVVGANRVGFWRRGLCCRGRSRFG
jgi:hypothetical protein